MFEPHFDEVRFRDLMLYLAYRCQDAVYFGSTKLCKLLYYSDFTAFARTGSPIAGAECIREVGFLIAADGETIPYEAAYLVSERDDELNRVIDRAFAAWVRNRDVE